MRFDKLDFSSQLLEGIDSIGFEEMTPVQEQAIPVILEKKDVLASAQTGTGKTAAFLLPLMELISRKPQRKGIQALVLAPTRELAIQIDLQVEGLGYFSDVNSYAIYGGGQANIFDRQKMAITEGTDILIATPGRLMQHVNLGYVDFSNLKYLVLDEADRMLDMGFVDDIKRIVKHLPSPRQTLMFSATFPDKIKRLAKEILSNPTEVSIAISKPAEKIKQSAYMTYPEQKIKAIKYLLKGQGYKSLVIFASTKQGVKDLGQALKSMQYKVGIMHSDLEQEHRQEVMHDFKTGKIEVLIATNIVARGIDIDSIELVVNFDVPRDPEDYVHRIGRTARAERDGEAITLITPKEIRGFKQIEDLIEKAIDKPSLPEEFGPTPSYSSSSDQRSEGNSKKRFSNKNRGKSGGPKKNFHRKKKRRPSDGSKPPQSGQKKD